MDVQLIDRMGSDLTVVNAARVSFDKESDWVTVREEITPNGWKRVRCEEGSHGRCSACEQGSPQACPDYREYKTTTDLSTKDKKLINYLARHGHWTPFSHVQIQMRETVPIFIARQRFKHMVGFTYNEISRRYVDSPPEFYKPDAWRKRADDKKQGSSDEVISLDWIKKGYDILLDHAEMLYTSMLLEGVAPEQARMVLPQSMYTSYYVTGSLAAWARAYKQRIDEVHAQKEITYLAKMWQDVIGNIQELKHSWTALTN